MAIPVSAEKAKDGKAVVTHPKLGKLLLFDPIDGSVSTRQGIRIIMSDDSRIVFRVRGNVGVDVVRKGRNRVDATEEKVELHAPRQIERRLESILVFGIADFPESAVDVAAPGFGARVLREVDAEVFARRLTGTTITLDASLA